MAITRFRATPSAKVFASPSVGSSTTPVSAAPSTVPTVFTEKTSPTLRPTCSSREVATRLASGRVMPRQNAGTNITAKQSRN